MDVISVIQIDSHQHYWKLSRGDYHWLSEDLGIIYQDYLPGDLEEDLKKSNIDRTIVVQAAPTIEETQFLLSLAKEEDTIAGVVGWLDFESPQFESDLQELIKDSYFVGVRPMIQGIEDDAWVLKPQVLKSIHILHERKVPLDLLVLPKHLPYILELCIQIPDLKGVINHLAKPDIKNHKLDPWREDLKKIAQFENMYCKLSGMVTEADHKHWSPNDLRPYVEHTLNIFGHKRVMFGSDWPVCLLAADTYMDVYEALQQVLPEGFSQDDRQALMGLNAARFYSLDG